MTGETSRAQDGDQVAEASQEICEHMNRDHADAVLLLCQHFGSVDVEGAQMVEVGPSGFRAAAVVDGREESVWIEFPEQVNTPNEVRVALIRMLREARGQ